MTKNTKTQTNETVPPAGAGVPKTDPRNDFHASTLGGSGFGTGSDHLRALRDIIIASIDFLLKRPKADFDKASQAQTPTRVIGVSGYVVPARQWDDPDQPKEKTGVFLADAAVRRNIDNTNPCTGSLSPATNEAGTLSDIRATFLAANNIIYKGEPGEPENQWRPQLEKLGRKAVQKSAVLIRKLIP